MENMVASHYIKVGQAAEPVTSPQCSAGHPRFHYTLQRTEEGLKIYE